jgi:rod shape-determining protein MreC
MLKRFTQNRPFATLALIAAAWLILPVVVKRVLRASFFEFTAPVALVASHVSDLQAYWSLRLHTNRELIEAGRDLARVNGFYEYSMQQNAALRADIAALEQSLGLPAIPGCRLEPARVAERDFGAWWQRLVIRKGRNYGIGVGDPVVFTGGVVGRVSEVHAYSSVVELVSSPNFRLAAILDGDTRPVSYEGQGSGAFGSSRGSIEFVPLDIMADPSTPRLLKTSGLGGLFPAGLAIGRLVRTNPSVDGLFKTGEIELDPRLGELAEVTVLVPKGPDLAAP